MPFAICLARYLSPAARIGHVQADSLDVSCAGGQASQHLLSAGRGEDQMTPPGELDRRGPPDSRASTRHEHMKLTCHAASSVRRSHRQAGPETDRFTLCMYLQAADDERPSREQILAVFDALARWTASDTFRGCPFVNAATELADPGHPARRVARDYKMQLRDYFARQAGRDGAEDPQRLADQLIVVFDGIIVQAVMGTAPHADAARTAVQALLDAQRIP